MYSYYRKETPATIEDALKWRPHFATIIPEIEHYNIPQETIEILKQNYESLTMTNRLTDVVVTENNERMIVIIDVSDLRARPCYSAGDAETVDYEMFQRWYWYKHEEMTHCIFDIKPYIHVNDIKKYNKIQDYDNRKRVYNNPIDFSVYYTKDGNIYVSETLGKVLEISNVTKLGKKLEEEKSKVFVKK